MAENGNVKISGEYEQVESASVLGTGSKVKTDMRESLSVQLSLRGQFGEYEGIQSQRSPSFKYECRHQNGCKSLFPLHNWSALSFSMCQLIGKALVDRSKNVFSK